VDVLIIGAGASGAAVAWSLADTKMHILCLEQGAWMNPATYPSTGRDWEARFFGDYSPSPNIRARPEDYPINDDNSPIKVVNFNGVGGGTVMYTAHFPRLHPSDFRVSQVLGQRARRPRRRPRARFCHPGARRHLLWLAMVLYRRQSRSSSCQGGGRPCATEPACRTFCCSRIRLRWK
jgi:choline dehydrogenase-like flavoprotein